MWYFPNQANQGAWVQIGGRGTNQGAGVGVKGQGCESRVRGAAQGAGEAFALVQEQLLSTPGLTGHLPTAFLDHAFASIFCVPRNWSQKVFNPSWWGFWRVITARISMDADLFGRSRPAAIPPSIWPNTHRSQKHEYWSQHTRIAFVRASLPFACFTCFVLGSFYEWMDTFDQHIIDILEV